LFLLDRSARPLEKLIELYESQVLAFYDPLRHTYFSLTQPPPGIERTETVDRAVAIHEITHALQDQRFRAGERLEKLRADWDGSMAYLALLEGEATAVMLAALAESAGVSFDVLVTSDQMVASLSSAAAANPGVPAGTPPYFVSSMKFPYLEGLPFVIDAYRKGGWKAVDALHTVPPTSTSQILHPEAYASREASSTSGSTRLVRSRQSLSLTLGEFHWRYLLGEQPATGWRSDRVEVMRTRHCRNCVLVDSMWSSEKDAGVEGSRVRLAYGRDQRSVEGAVRSRAWGAASPSP